MFALIQSGSFRSRAVGIRERSPTHSTTRVSPAVILEVPFAPTARIAALVIRASRRIVLSSCRSLSVRSRSATNL